ncbi:MAG: serine/threonine-protein kinase [Planctomycetota bacterium]|jgi:tetratricopeptide (TPR) repeat protein/predicted Ser/Thr protein kinase
MIGSSIGPYTIVSELGAGGMGTVYLGEGEGKKVAIKVVHAHLIATPGFFKRFLREAELGKQVKHENVVRTFDVDATIVDDKQVNYMVMEYVEGRSLRELLADLGTVPEALLREIALQVSDGLAAIHGAGIVHRDLKPENVLITDDQRVRIMDLGVAKLQEASVRITREGQFAGSFLYAAPEQFRNQEVSGAADLYSLGVVLHELATGQNPFRADDASAVIHAHLNTVPPPASERAAGISRFTSEVIQTLLAKDPDARFESAQALHDLLQEGEQSAWWGERERELRKGTSQLPPIQVARDTGVYGREEQIEILRSAFERATAGEGSTVFIEGEPGIGKTRLVDAFLQSIAGEETHILYGAYPPSGGLGGLSEAVLGKFGAAGLAESLAPYLTVTPSLVPAFAALIRHEAAPTGSEPLQGDALQAVCCHLMHALAAEKPTVWVLDELHFAPQESRQVVLALARSIAPHNALLVLTARPGLPEDDLAHLARLENFKRVPLGRLSPREVIRVLRDAFKSEALAEKLAGKIGFKSDGVPFFLFEMMRGLREGGFLKQKADGSYEQTQNITDVQVPSAVKDLVEGRLRGLSDDDRGLLDVAALLGVEFDPDLVAQVRGKKLIEVLERLASLERRNGIIRASGRNYRFDHFQIQEILENGIAERLKEEYHAMLADAYADREALEPGEAEGEDAVFLARHYLRSSRPKKALKELDGALAYLAGGYRNDAAIELAEVALSTNALLKGARRIDTLLQQAEALGVLGRRDEEHAALDEARTLAEEDSDLERQGRAHGQLGAHFWLLSKFDDAKKHTQRGIELSGEAGNQPGQASAMRVLGNILFDLGDFEGARQRFEESLRIAEGCGDKIATMAATINIGNVSSPLGKYADARDYSERGVALAVDAKSGLGRAVASVNLGFVLGHLGRHDEARTILERSVAQVQEVGNRRIEAEGLRYLGLVLENQGEHAEGESACDISVRVGREIAYAKEVAASLLVRGRIRATGDRAGSIASLEEARAIARDLDVPEIRALAASRLCVLADEDESEPRADLDRNQARIGVPARMEAHYLLWRASGAAADLEEAHRLLQSLVENAPEDCRESMIENVPLHREITEAWRDR